MGFIEKYFSKEKLTESDLESFIQQGIEENQNLEYKRFQSVKNN